MCHDAITLSACGHPLHITPKPCYRLVTTNFCTGLVRTVEVLGDSCDICIGNIGRLRELTGRSIAWDMEEGDYYLGGMEGEKGDDGGGNAEAAGVEGEDGEDGEKEEGEGEGEGELRSFQRKLYTDEAYERLRKECYRRVWSTCFDGG